MNARGYLVYRCFDRDGGLLYVGCTANVKRRMGQHAKGGKSRASHALSALMASYTTEGPFATREDAEAAERIAIRNESPLLNIAHGNLPGWLADRRLEDYLTELGLPLAVGGLHRCPDCDLLRGYHMAPGPCSNCREDAPAQAEAGVA